MKAGDRIHFTALWAVRGAKGVAPTAHLAAQSAVGSHPIAGNKKTLPQGQGFLLPTAGDRIRTDDVQLGKLAFYH